MDCHKSKWGFHACDRETYQKLQALYKRYFETQRQIGAWSRWHRKQPQNRVFRPKLCHSGKPYGYGRAQPWPEPQVCKLFARIDRHGQWVLNALGGKVYYSYQTARTPYASPEEVRGITLSIREINDLYEQL